MISLRRDIMGMPITVGIVGATGDTLHEHAFDLLREIDRRFSPFRADSEVTALNTCVVTVETASRDMLEILALSALTRAETRGYFDIRRPDGTIDPSGIVKGWAIRKAARLLASLGATDFFVEAGGDVAMHGRNAEGGEWRTGIRSPFDPEGIVQVIYPRGRGVATSGSYARGRHIYDPHRGAAVESPVVSLTVIGPDVLEADRFATAAFAMGESGIEFIEDQFGLEGYQIDAAGIATMTSGFEAFTRT
jgi:thiamine biosynthesis lipoprotein